MLAASHADGSYFLYGINQNLDDDNYGDDDIVELGCYSPFGPETCTPIKKIYVGPSFRYATI
jgi:hypothetical protein